MEIGKSYSPEEIEDKWYEFWEREGMFQPRQDMQGEPFSIVIPPPNVTGSLHMGHALNATVQDVLSRWKRMLGYRVLWLPGTDHAGIATQNVVERELAKESIDRHRLGREEFINRVWQWKAEYGGKIIHQLKKLGASCDWSRERFTLDEGLSQAVRDVFVRLFEEGLMYRDSRLINWCPRCHTALSDLEVEYEETDGRLYYIIYPLADGPGALTVATTRPETMLGDTAVAVHPEDARYKNYIGRMIRLPLAGRLIPVVADESVDMQFGTGAVKITPSHDFNDEATARRHNLPFLNVMTEDGHMNSEAGAVYAGLDRTACRRKVVEDLKLLELLDSEKKHKHSVGHCYRCKTVIEPFDTIQWYVKIESIAKEAIAAVQEKRIHLIPEGWENNYFGWMRDIRDWCVSRQIWWGHQIPVWYCPDCATSEGHLQGELIEHIFFEPFGLRDGLEIAGGTYAELRRKGMSHADIAASSKIIRIPRQVKPLCSRTDLTACPSCGSGQILRDPDVLDTWFSSALWPFSTLGWPDETPDVKAFYPTSVLVTGFDILFFWVARMIMMGLKCTGEVPFRDVYIHALVRDAKGQKMSKSKGNVVDPLTMIDRFGADAFRFSLAAFAAQGRDIRFSEERVEGYRHFINKLWNATRFMVGYTEFRSVVAPSAAELAADTRNSWILSRLSHCADDVNRNLGAYRFNEAANSIYHFIWHEFCDWYLELVKPDLYGDDAAKKRVVADCLFFVLERVVLMLHPFMPFVTEELWQRVLEKKKSITHAAFPCDLPCYPEAERRMTLVLDIISGIRSIRGELNINPSLEITVQMKTLNDDALEAVEENRASVIKLTRCRDLQTGRNVSRTKGSAMFVTDSVVGYIPIEGLLDLDAEIARLGKEKAKVEEAIAFFNKKLMNEDFLKSAPKNIVEKDRAKFEELARKNDKIADNLNLLKTIQ
ncbi:MAG: valyl-tRNA synthetase [Nitrospirae bacterium]|nr:MAG: valyl-tRNA synthetase [Nitrospirota bacterium]